MIPCRVNPMGSPYLRKLSYLESTGTQYIDTGVAPDFAGGDRIEIRFYAASYSGTAPCIFGSRESGVLNCVYCLGNTAVVADADGYSSVPILINIGGDDLLRVNDSAIASEGMVKDMPRRVTVGLPIFLFALNNYGTGTYGIYNGMRLYDWKYYRNSTLAQHLVPVLDRANTPCLFDMVSRKFVYNAGTGTFIYA